MCSGCRERHAAEWATRCIHEAALHDDNSFVTLTYRDEELPAGAGLDLSHLQKFLKRLRKRTGRRFRYYACGEYGENTDRPHYHALLFGLDFPDREIFFRNHQGDAVYTSQLLDDIWQLGHCTIGEVTPQSCGYTARYVMKKWKNINDGPENFHPKYLQWDPETGEILKDNRVEFSVMSRGSGHSDPDPRFRGGIGKAWFDKYKADVFPHDYVVRDGKKLPVPARYSAWMEAHDPDVMLDVKRRRNVERKLREEHTTSARLKVREFIHLEKMKLLKRGLQNG